MPTLICVTPESEKINYNMKMFSDNCYPDRDDDDDCSPDENVMGVHDNEDKDSSDTCWPD